MAAGEGILASIAQKIVNIGSGSVLALGQTIELKKTGVGKLASIAQVIKSSGSGNLCAINQRVLQAGRGFAFNQPSSIGGVTDFDLDVYIGSNQVPQDILSGEIQITRNEGDSALCSIGLMPKNGVIDLDQWHGKTVTIDAVTDSASYRIYTGIVDIPDIDIINQRIVLSCTDQRLDRNNALDKTYVSGIGYWSEDLFGESEDQNEEIEQRLSTIPYSLDYDAWGSYYLTAWEPKATPDYIFSDASIYRRSPSVTVLSRGRVTNQVNLTIEYQYQRLRHREVNYSFDSGLDVCRYSIWGLPPTVIQLTQAISGAGWPYHNFTWDGLDDAGRYNCFGATVLWATATRSGTTVQVFDDDNNPVLDQNGNPTYKVIDVSVNQYQDLYAQTASWKATNRWAQNITERINLTVSAPQSIAQYGLVERDMSVSVQSEYDTESWEDYNAYKSPPSNAVLSGNGDYVIDKNVSDLPKYQSAVYAALSKARTEIIKAHRDNRVTIEVPFIPQIDLRHTVELTAGKIRCKGKVSAIKHNFDLSDPDCYTELEISLSRSTGSATDSGAVLPARPTVTDSANDVEKNIRLGSRTIPIGATQNTSWNGYIFQQVSNSGTQGLKVPVAMIVDTPAIDDASRDTKEQEVSRTNTVAIRNDLLDVEFNE